MTADNFKHNPPILQTNLKNVISKQLDTDNEQQMSNEQMNSSLYWYPKKILFHSYNSVYSSVIIHSIQKAIFLDFVVSSIVLYQ